MNLNKTWAEPELEEIEGPPHPSTLSSIEVIERTPWIYCDDARPVPKSHEKSTRCQIAEEITRDPYGLILSVKPIVRHQYYDEKQKRWNSDVACSAITAQNYLRESTQTGSFAGLKDRFGTALAAYERGIANDPERRDAIPLVLASDVIHPLMINAANCHGIRTLNDFAGMTKQVMDKLGSYLAKHGKRQLSQNVKTFKDKAQEKLDGLLGVPAKEAA